MKISLLGRLSHCRKGSKLALIDLALELGVTGVELVDDERVTPAEVHQIRAYLDDFGVELVSLHIPVGLAVEGSSVRSQSLDRAHTSLERAALLGTGTVMLSPLPSSLADSVEANRDSFQEMVKQLMPDVIRLGLRPTFNNSGNYTGSFGRVEYCRRLCEQFAPDAGMTFDVGNLLLAGEEQTAATEQLAPWIAVVHLKDWIVESGTGSDGHPANMRLLLRRLNRWVMDSPARNIAKTAARMLGISGAIQQRSRLFRGLEGTWYRGAIIGEGILDHEMFLKQLRQIGYGGYLSIEYEGGGDLKTAYRQGAERVRQILENLATAG